ncbi:MAG TPA: hypothetical protein VF275_02000 [Gammaproteobacteria bacterium]
MRRAFALVLVFLAGAAFAADGPIPSGPVISLAQAQVGVVRLVVWETDAGIEAQVLDAASHEALSERLSLGEQTAGSGEPQTGSVSTRPAVAVLADNGGAVFFVAWHAELLDASSNGIGAELVGQNVSVDADNVVTVGPLLRISRVDDDSNATAGSEPRSTPAVVAKGDEFLVLWTHWPNGKTLDADSISHDDYFIFGQEVLKDGTLVGNAAIQMDALTAPANEDGFPARADINPIFLTAVAFTNKPGYLLAWSDPAQEGGPDSAQLFSKLLPANLADTDIDARNALGAASVPTKGTGRVAVAPLPDGDGYLLAYEDLRGMGPLDGLVLDADGKATAGPIHLLNGITTGDHAFLSPQLVSVPGEDRLLLFAAVGDFSISGELPVDELLLEKGRLVQRLLDPDDLAFSKAGSDFETMNDAYPDVNIFFAAQAHVAGNRFDGKGAVTFTAVPGSAEIAVNEFLFSAEPPAPPPPTPPSPPPANGGDEGGGGALLALLFLLPFVRAGRRRFAMVAGATLLAFAGIAQASPPDLELLHTEKDGTSCYRSVMYREVSEIRIANSWGKTPIPAGTPIEITDLPTGWHGEVLVEGNIQYVRLNPAPFDTVSGISIGRICMKFPAMSAEPQSIPYVYDLVSSGSPIMATARPDDGVSDDQLRAMVKRGERLKQGDIHGKPKALEENVKTVKRIKGLFD